MKNIFCKILLCLVHLTAAAPLVGALPSQTHQAATAEMAATVCKVGGCSGVIIDRSGLVMTAKHCTGAGPLPVLINGHPPRLGELVHLGKNQDGPAVYQFTPPAGADLQAATIADGPPTRGSRVESYGYLAGSTTVQHAVGVLTHGGHFPVWNPSQNQILTVKGNHTGPELVTGPGWSGGPLFCDGHLVGILTGGNPETGSTWISWADTAAAFRATVNSQPAPPGDQRPELRIWSQNLCPPCMAFWSDYKKDRNFQAAIDEKFRIRKLDPSDHPQQAAADRVDSLPTFVSDTGIRVVGYSILNANRKENLASGLGLTKKAPAPIPDTPPAPTPAVDWEAVQVILLVEARDTSQLAGLLLALIEGRATGPIRRAVSDATDGQADLVPVFERTEPARFEAVQNAAGVEVQTLHVLALVKEQDLGFIRGIIAKRLERALAEKLDFTPIVEVITERGHAADYQAISQALDTEPTAPWRPDPAPTEPPDEPPEDSAEGITDRLLAALKVAQDLRSQPATPASDQPGQIPWDGITAGGVSALLARHLARAARIWWYNRESAA
jgi:hypothetical protein